VLLQLDGIDFVNAKCPEQHVDVSTAIP